MVRERHQLCSRCMRRMYIWYDSDKETGISAFFYCEVCDKDKLDEMKDENRK